MLPLVRLNKYINRTLVKKIHACTSSINTPGCGERHKDKFSYPFNAVRQNYLYNFAPAHAASLFDCTLCRTKPRQTEQLKQCLEAKQSKAVRISVLLCHLMILSTEPTQSCNLRVFLTEVEPTCFRKTETEGTKTENAKVQKLKTLIA